MWPNPQETADLVTFTEEILMGKFVFWAVKPDSYKNILGLKTFTNNFSKASYIKGNAEKNEHNRLRIKRIY